MDLSKAKVDLGVWNLFSLIDKSFLKSIRLACVFGNLGNEGIMIDENDDVWALGSNGTGCLGTGDMVSSLEPRKIDALSSKRIINLSFGSGPHVLALSQSGQVYSWGHNGYCQLGNGSTTQGLIPTLIGGALSERIIADIACGSHHSICVSESGDIFAWGQNNCGQVGSGTTTNQSTPKKISAPFGGKKVISVSCGQTSSVVALENGEVYGWGYNGNGQLGLGNNINQLNPTKISSLQGLVVTKVVCGYAHTLALTDEGYLYSWGANSYGQLGCGNKANSSSPGRAAVDIGRIVDIAASHYNHTSAAVTQDSKVFMWGQCYSQAVIEPKETPFKTLAEVFANAASPSITPQPITTSTVIGPSVNDSLRLAFDDPETSDLVILAEDKPIHVHKALLKIRSQHFRSMFNANWQENSKDSIAINQFSYEVYRAFLQYLYTDEVSLDPDDAIGLLDLAISYCEDQLQQRCKNLIKESITVENVAQRYATAIRYDAKDLEEFCFRFSLNHMTAMTQSESFQNLDVDVMKSFIAKAAQNGAFKS